MPDKPLEKGQNSVEPQPFPGREASALRAPRTPPPCASRRTAWSVATGALIILVAIALFWLDKRRTPSRSPSNGVAAVDRSMLARIPSARFVDITGPAGIHFVHNNGAYGDKLLPE